MLDIKREEVLCKKSRILILSWVISSPSEKKYASVISFAHNLDSKDKMVYLLANHQIIITLKIIYVIKNTFFQDGMVRLMGNHLIIPGGTRQIDATGK